MSATELMRTFWRNQAARGETPSPVYAIVSDGGMQPKGYCMGWSVNKRAAQRQADRLGFPCSVVRVSPPAPPRAPCDTTPGSAETPARSQNCQGTSHVRP